MGVWGVDVIYTFPQVERKQQLIESLQKDLSGSQSLCDSLKLEVSTELLMSME